VLTAFLLAQCSEVRALARSSPSRSARTTPHVHTFSLSSHRLRT
jgi:hypothetical protein